MSSSSSLRIGVARAATLRVESADLASSISREAGDAFPNFFPTSRMVGLMDIASSRMLQQYLQPGQLSVLVEANIKIAPTAPTEPEVVAVEATFLRLDREWNQELYVFDVVARDATGEVGWGTHKRAIVDVDGLEQNAQKRNPDDSQSS